MTGSSFIGRNLQPLTNPSQPHVVWNSSPERFHAKIFAIMKTCILPLAALVAFSSASPIGVFGNSIAQAMSQQINGPTSDIQCQGANTATHVVDHDLIPALVRVAGDSTGQYGSKEVDKAKFYHDNPGLVNGCGFTDPNLKVLMAPIFFADGKATAARDLPAGTVPDYTEVAPLLHPEVKVGVPKDLPPPMNKTPPPHAKVNAARDVKAPNDGIS